MAVVFIIDVVTSKALVNVHHSIDTVYHYLNHGTDGLGDRVVESNGVIALVVSIVGIAIQNIVDDVLAADVALALDAVQEITFDGVQVFKVLYLNRVMVV